jgi:hypothetical protein
MAFRLQNFALSSCIYALMLDCPSQKDKTLVAIFCEQEKQSWGFLSLVLLHGVLGKTTEVRFTTEHLTRLYKNTERPTTHKTSFFHHAVDYILIWCVFICSVLCVPHSCQLVVWRPLGGPVSWPGRRPPSRWAAGRHSGPAGRPYSAPRPFLSRASLQNKKRFQ